MYPSSTLCRTQEAYQRDRAANSTLENVRTLAGKAAIAWGLEALAAERREARRDQTQIIKDTKEHSSWPAQNELVSENPDRGLANP